MTPSLPAWIRKKRLEGYTSVFDLLPDETRLFGTEDLYGDWNGRTLLLAQDFACSEFVRERVRKGDRDPYRHEPELRTNVALRRFADPFRTGDTPTTCGLLYGSALACLLKDGSGMSAPLPNRTEAIDFGTRVVSFVVSQMLNLQVIICLGEVAWICATDALGVENPWRETRDSGDAIDAGNLKVIAAFHPAARVSHERAAQPWEVVRNALITERAA